MTVSAKAEDLWAVLADGWTYASWVVGASHIREVDAHWPEPGARVHHTVGVWPLTTKDTTSVVTSEPGRLLELDARAWPIGRARVRIELNPVQDGRTRIVMTETVAGGPGRLLPTPVTDLALRARNREALHRLVDIALGRHEHAAPPSPAPPVAAEPTTTKRTTTKPKTAKTKTTKPRTGEAGGQKPGASKARGTKPEQLG